jgi:hypothetical protein
MMASGDDHDEHLLGEGPDHDGQHPPFRQTRMDTTPGWASPSTKWGFIPHHQLLGLASCHSADLCRPSPPPGVVATSMVANELWGQLLARERELNSREDGLVASECGLWRAHTDCDATCSHAEAARQDYRTRLHTSSFSSKCSISFNRMLEEC